MIGTAQTRFLGLIAILLGVLGGCSRKADLSSEAELRAWLDVCPNPEVWRIDASRPRPIPFPEWIERGKEFANLEDRLIHLLGKDKVPRKAIIDALGWFGTETCAPHLIHLIELGEINEKQDAVSALGRVCRVGNPEAIKALCNVLADSDLILRLRALIVLEAIGDESAIPIVSELTEDPEVLIRQKAIATLAAIKFRARRTTGAPIKP